MSVKPNRNFLAFNNIADGIMRKNSTTAKLTKYEIQRNKRLSKVRYIVEQYFGLSHLHDGAKRARFRPGSTSAIGTAILELLYHPQKRSALAQAGRNSILQQFGEQQMVDAYQRVYHALVSPQRWSRNR